MEKRIKSKRVIECHIGGYVIVKMENEQNRYKAFFFITNVLLIEKALAENVSAFLFCIGTRYRLMTTKIIYCPECHRKLGSCDSRTTIPKVPRITSRQYGV